MLRMAMLGTRVGWSDRGWLVLGDRLTPPLLPPPNKTFSMALRSYVCPSSTNKTGSFMRSHVMGQDSSTGGGGSSVATAVLPLALEPIVVLLVVVVATTGCCCCRRRWSCFHSINRFWALWSWRLTVSSHAWLDSWYRRIRRSWSCSCCPKTCSMVLTWERSWACVVWNSRSVRSDHSTDATRYRSTRSRTRRTHSSKRSALSLGDKRQSLSKQGDKEVSLSSSLSLLLLSQREEESRVGYNCGGMCFSSQ